MFAGVPSLFVRTSGCPLRCEWCDTKYSSWAPEGEQEDVDELTTYCGKHPASHIVITGGEPCMFAGQVGHMLFQLQSRYGKVVTVETSGALGEVGLSPDLWSVSPKLASAAPVAGPERDLHLRNNDLSHMAAFQRRTLHSRVQFKFVMSSEADVAEVEKLVGEHKLLPQFVWAMPEGRTKDEVLTRGAWLAEVCKERGWNLCLRQQILIWGNRRGT